MLWHIEEYEPDKWLIDNGEGWTLKECPCCHLPFNKKKAIAITLFIETELERIAEGKETLQ